MAFGPVTLALWIYCLVDMIGHGDDELRILPRLWWRLTVPFFRFAGSISNLLLDVRRVHRASLRTSVAVRECPEYDRPCGGLAGRERRGGMT